MQVQYSFCGHVYIVIDKKLKETTVLGHCKSDFNLTVVKMRVFISMSLSP